ncbi:arabinofuranosidase catalytic domain-containing protein [Streptomyces sp. NRRL F-5123]|uniref:arabinofuranosidase catalytic domain-containing protein n=1 Tax=Streptomyces sp. NRRL F-5123 TaxID=1463856 RepID=UPI00099BB2AE|nr:arabinofuranosidase catalytic domain-containing protein [Streptomyces sp. NRRL F-5123]
MSSSATVRLPRRVRKWAPAAGAAATLVVGLLVGGTASSQAAGSAPCDIYASGGTPCVAAHSTTRALYSSYNGALYQVRRSSDNSTRDIGVIGAGGYADAAAQDSFCSGTGCVITVVYDQSGRGNNLTQAPPGGFAGPAAGGYDNLADATAAPITIAGHKAYGVYSGNGPWIMADLENGLFSGVNQHLNSGDPTINYRYTTAIVKGGPNHWAIRGGNAQSGSLSTFYDGVRPNVSGYNPMKKQGAIILGIGGDNSHGATGTFYEGVMTSGYPSEATENAVQANITAAGYGSNTGGSTDGGTSTGTTDGGTTTGGSTGGTSGGCTATYTTTNSWSGGFQGEVKVTAGSTAVNGWTVHWTLANGQTLTQVWNGTLTTSGSTATVKNADYNGSLQPSASTTFGFLANGSPNTPTLTCTSP